jgi:hypothetical protein
MSPRNTESAPAKSRVKSTATVALVAALLGGTGGIVITPRMESDAISKTDLREALAPIASELKELRADVVTLREEMAVARYARERASTRP